METTELNLIQQAQNGESEAFGKLYDKYIKKIYDFIYFKTHHRETAEDLTSKTFVKALKAITSFDTSKGTFNAWIYQIARNTVTDHYRTSHPAVNIDDVWDLKADIDIPRDADTAKKLDEVKEYLETLPADQRDIVLLRVWQQLSYKEIAAIVGKSEDSCKMSFSRTINKLRDTEALLLLLLMLTLR